MKKIKLIDNRWDEEIYILIEPDYKKVENYLLKKHHIKQKDLDIDAAGFYFEEIKDIRYIWLSKCNTNDCDDLDVLVHELNHLVFYVLKERGFELNEGSCEAYAYYQGELFGQAYYKLKNLK